MTKHRTRFARTMQEAFGPYTSDQLDPLPDKASGYSALWWVAVVVIAAIGGALTVLGVPAS